MKKLIPLLILILLLTACGGRSTSGSDISEGVSGGDSSGIGDTPTGGNSEVNRTNKNPAVKHDNPREDYTHEEVAEMINKFDNLTVSDEFFYTSVPKTIDHVSEFYTGPSVPLPRQEALDEFLAVYEYLFPDHEFDKSCLYYYALTQEDIDNYTGIIEGDPVKDENYLASLCLYPLYDERYYGSYMDGSLNVLGGPGYYFYNEMLRPSENSVALSMRSPFGNDICMFNKGIADKICEERYYGNTEYSAGEFFNPNYSTGLSDPETMFESVGFYPPDSEETFMLLDREISIKDAVKFFEDYIASIPGTVEPAYGIHVNEVEVFRVDNEHFYYEYHAARIYDGIHFSSEVYGGMIKSDDVETVIGTLRAYLAEKETQYTEIIPFEEAVRTVSEKVTEYVDFKVERAELVYTHSFTVSGFDGEANDRVHPAWKFRLDNPNDDIYYHAYVNAVDGEFSIERSNHGTRY